MQESLIVGVDVSKSTLDIYFKPVDRAFRIVNHTKGFRQWIRELKKLSDGGSKVLVVMEHTGRYSWRFESFLRSRSIDYCKVAALQIKRSLGVIRGKNDQVDAERIANYGWLRRDILTADEPPVEGIRELRELLSLRSKMVRDRSGYMSRLKEMKACGSGTQRGELEKMQQKMVDTFTKNIHVLEAKIKSVIKGHSAIQTTSDLLRSIKGIGWIIAAYMISYTDNFKRFNNARKFNCYAGLAPFKHESGSSIKGRARVSHLANKEAKTLLSLAASSAIQHDEEMKRYYRRRIEEGKRKMSCLNIIRSKLVARMFAVVKRQTPYLALTAA
jgi:transposase